MAAHEAGRLFPSVLSALSAIEPETVIRWHRMGFRLYWRWKSRSRGGRPQIPGEIRRLIREMSLANRLWGGAWFVPAYGANGIYYRVVPLP
jgi:hypothetical protein